MEWAHCLAPTVRLPWSGEEEIISRNDHQGHLHYLPDSEDRPHGGPAEDVTHVHDDLNQDPPPPWSLVTLSSTSCL